MGSVAVIADVHGNYPALAAVLAEIDREGADRMYCLGDLVGYYCFVNEVIDTIRERTIVSLLGNHDAALAFSEGVIARSRIATAVLQRQRTYITARNLRYLESLPTTQVFEAGGRSCFGVHGGLADALDEYIHDMSDDYLRRHEFQHDVLLTAQTHRPAVRQVGERLWANPGSVGQPRDGDPRAAYLLIRDGAFTIRRVAYDIGAVVDGMRAMGFPDVLADGLAAGRAIGSRSAGVE